MKQSVELPLTETKKEQEKSVPLTPIQKAMFRTMTESLSIPQLGYKDEIELNAIISLVNETPFRSKRSPTCLSLLNPCL
ncbi:hypothetical protein RMATCC62417_17636 [Rhizopus microsporus]|nr:hypothetical protein RMATCC62417_17636 [Rhizopus microsporus]